MFYLPRHALKDSFERAVFPGIAAIVQFIDVGNNIDLLKQDTKDCVTTLWLEIFKKCADFGLNYSNITQQAEGQNTSVRRFDLCKQLIVCWVN